MCDQESFGLVQDENRDLKERLEKIDECVETIFDRINRTPNNLESLRRMVKYNDHWLNQIKEHSTIEE